MKRCAVSRDSTTNWLSYWNIPVLNRPVTSNFQNRGTATPSAGFILACVTGTSVITSPLSTDRRLARREPSRMPPSTPALLGLKLRSPRTTEDGSEVTGAEPVSVSQPSRLTPSP